MPPLNLDDDHNGYYRVVIEAKALLSVTVVEPKQSVTRYLSMIVGCRLEAVVLRVILKEVPAEDIINNITFNA